MWDGGPSLGKHKRAFYKKKKKKHIESRGPEGESLEAKSEPLSRYRHRSAAPPKASVTLRRQNPHGARRPGANVAKDEMMTCLFVYGAKEAPIIFIHKPLLTEMSARH